MNVSPCKFTTFFVSEKRGVSVPQIDIFLESQGRIFSFFCGRETVERNRTDDELLCYVVVRVHSFVRLLHKNSK